MNDITLLRRGSGGTKLFAAIGVTYPAGSTLTCTNGSKTLTAKTTTGQWVFAIPEAGTWTVTATDGTQTASKTVEITSEGQFESVTLGYNIVAFADGEYIDIGGMSGVTLTNNELVLDARSTGSICKWSFSDIPVDVTNYSTLYWDLRWENNNGQNAEYRSAGVGLSKTKTPVTTEAAGVTDPKTQFVASKIITTYPYAQMVAIDISALSGEYYLAAYSTSWSSGSSTNTVLYSKEIRIE